LELMWVAEDWFIFLGGLLAILLMIGIMVDGSEYLGKRGITSWGPVIFVRTTRGLAMLNRLARFGRLWRPLATAGVPLVVAGMFYFLALLLLINYMMILMPPEPGDYNAPRNILLIPGVNQYIPLVWGWIALAVTIVVHEFAHGVLCRVEGVRVRSMGAIFLLFPLGAFVEPDDEELFGSKNKPAVASRAARIRILSAGVIANFAIAALALFLFFGPVLSAIAPVDSVVVADVEEGSQAQAEGFEKGMIVSGFGSLDEFYSSLVRSGSSAVRVIREGDGTALELNISGSPARGVMVISTFDGSPARLAKMPERFLITGLNGTPAADLESFRSLMAATIPGQPLSVDTDRGSFQINLDDRGDGTGMIGVGLSGSAVDIGGAVFQIFPARPFLDVLRSIPSSGLIGFNTLMSLPFRGVSGFTEDGFQGFSGNMLHFFQPVGWAEPLGGRIFWLANLLLWVGWINLYAGLFNCLPAVPLDGGHVFRDLVRLLLDPLVRDERRSERLTGAAVMLLSGLIIFSLLFTVIGPYLAHGLPS